MPLFETQQEYFDFYKTNVANNVDFEISNIILVLDFEENILKSC